MQSELRFSAVASSLIACLFEHHQSKKKTKTSKSPKLQQNFGKHTHKHLATWCYHKLLISVAKGLLRRQFVKDDDSDFNVKGL